MATSIQQHIHAAHSCWLDEADFDLDDFRVQVERDTDLADYPHADDVRSNVLIYDAAATAKTSDRRALQAELIRALADGPGVVVFAGAFDAGVVDRASEAFFAIIEAQQKVIDRDPARPVLPVTFDKGVVLFNRLVERLAREERDGVSAAA